MSLEPEASRAYCIFLSPSRLSKFDCLIKQKGALRCLNANARLRTLKDEMGINPMGNLMIIFEKRLVFY
jgi:hypothetical protein